MSHHQRNHFLGNVPFSWEYKPGLSKEEPRGDDSPDSPPTHAKLKLRPPPCPSDSPRLSYHSIYVPLPPCPFQPLPRSSGFKREEDPFLAAYMECTKSVKPSSKGSKRGGGSTGKFMGAFGCKHSCGVRDDSIVKLSQLPALRDIKRYSETKRILAHQWFAKDEKGKKWMLGNKRSSYEA